MKLRSSFVLIRASTPEKVRASGLVIPDTAHERPSQGTVVGAGPDCPDIHEGDEVLFSKYAGTALKVGDDDLLMVPAHDIFAVVD